MDDPSDPKDLAWNWGAEPQFRPFSAGWRRVRVPRPPGPPPKLSKAEREQEKHAEARAERLHLAGLTSAWVIVMGIALAAVVVLVVVALLSRR